MQLRKQGLEHQQDKRGNGKTQKQLVETFLRLLLTKQASVEDTFSLFKGKDSKQVSVQLIKAT